MTSSHARIAIGQRLRWRRNDLGLTQNEVAAKTGLQPSWISHFERGRRMPTIPVLARLADALGTTMDGLYGRGHG